MARGEKAKESKRKEKLYDADAVPAIMPFPELAGVHTTKGQEIPVPYLNEHQRSWILGPGIRDLDLASLKAKAKSTNLAYEKVKADALASKPFQHTPQPTDRDDEDKLPGLIAAWKKAHATKGKKKAEPANDAGDESDQEEDADGRGALLRGYPRAGWRIAIQKVISNKRTAEINRLKKPTVATDEAVPEAPAAAMAKVFGIVATTGRDAFREDRRDDINECAKTLPGDINAGGKSRQAEALLWKNEDPELWAAAASAASNEGVNWKQRQQLVPGCFTHFVQTLNGSGKFRPFVATMVMGWLAEDGKIYFEWAEGLPSDIRAPQSFREQHPKLASDTVDAMYTWAEKPLKEYLATLENSAAANGAPPVFSLSVEALDEKTPKEVAEKVKDFLVESYNWAFGTPDIEWAELATEPDKYYDTTKFPVVFTATGLVNVQRRQWDELATAFASGAGAGTSGFFRKVAPPSRSPTPPPQPPSRSPTPPPQPPSRSPTPPPHPPSRSPTPRGPPPPPSRSPTPPPHARSRSPTPPPQPRSRSPTPPPQPPWRSPSPRGPPPPPRSPSPTPPPPPPPPQQKKKGRKGNNEGPPQDDSAPPPQGPKKGRKRKAEAQLVPGDEDDSAQQSGTRRAVRQRKTPEEAKLERQQKAAAFSKAGAKPSYVYVEKSPAKPRGSKK